MQFFKTLLDGTLGTCKCNTISLKLKPNATLKYHKPHAIPLKHYDKVKEEVGRLEELDTIKRDCNAESAAPCFTRPKSDNAIRFLTDFRELNKNLIRNPFPLPRIDEMLQSLGGFSYASKLDLSIGYFHFLLDNLSKSLTSISLLWGDCCYK